MSYLTSSMHVSQHRQRVRVVNDSIRVYKNLKTVCIREEAVTEPAPLE